MTSLSLSLPPRFRRCALAAAVSWAAATAWANPVGPTVVNGGASFSQQGSTLTVTNTPGAIINWQQFSVGIGETTRFVQQNAASAVLNRVVGQDPSSILGTLQSNGRVYLVNPNGIVFGAGAVVDVAGLVASTLGLSDQDFLAGRNVFSGGSGAGSLSNQGSIATAQGGQVYLVAPNIDNSGIIRAPGGEVILAAGHSVDLVDPANPQISVALDAPDTQAVNVGQVLAQGGRIGIYGALVNQRGTVSADTAVAGENGKIVLRASKTLLVEGGSVTSATNSAGQGGEIQLLGDQVGLTGNAAVDASGAAGGGTVLVGGDSRGANPLVQNASATFVGADATVRADALAAGNGGKVVVWGTDAARVYGALSARGGALSGNGGFIETSGGYLDVTRTPDVSAPNGLGGSWLLDPYDIIIGATDTPATYTGSPNFVGAGGGSTSYIGASVINTALDAGNVIVDTTGAGTGTGNITLDSGSTIGRTAAGTSTLTLQAHNDIILNGNITATAPGVTNVVLVADQDSSGAGAVAINAPINTNGGNVTISSSGNITFNASQGLGYDNIVAGAGSVTLSSSLGSIVGDPWGSPYDVMASSVNVTAKTGIGDMYGSMFYLSTPSVTFSNTGTGGVGIYVNFGGASSISGSNSGGGVRLDSFDLASPTNIGPITAAGNIYLRVNNPNIVGAVNAGANTVYLNPYTISPTVLPVSIGGAQTTDFTQTELNYINAGGIVVGYDGAWGNTTSTLTVDSSVNLGSRNITLKGDTIILTGGTLTATGGITLNSSSGITLNGLLDAGAGNVSMTAVSSIADGNGVSVNNVNANSLTATGTTIDLDTSVNTLSATATSGLLNLREADGANVTSLSATSNISLSSTTGSLALGTVSAGGTVDLSAPGGNLTGGVVSGTSLMASALGMNLGTNVGSLSLLANGVSGGISINQAGAVTVSSASAIDGPIDIHAGGAMNVVGAVAGGAWGMNLSTSSGNLTVGSLDATGDYVNLAAEAGAIIDGNGAINNIVATGTKLKASAGIGGAADPLEMQVTDLWSAGGSGGTYIANASSLLNAWNMTGAGVALTHGGGDLGVGLIDVGGGDASLAASSGAIKDLNGAGVNNFVARNLTLAAANGADFDYMISGALDASGVTGVVNARVYSTATSPTVTQTVNTTTASTNTLATPVSEQQQTVATATPVEKKEDAAAEDKAANGENGKNGDQGEKKKDAKKPRSCN